VKGALLVQIAAMAVFACTLQANARAQPSFNGKLLFDWCTADQQSEAYVYCILWISGFMNGVATAQLPQDNQTKNLCLPDGTDAHDVAAAFVKMYRSLRDKHDPDFKKRISDEAVQYVLPTLLMAAYPCKNLPN
jgi:hypothetical protein